MENEIMISNTAMVEATFKPFSVQIAEFKKANDDVVFDLSKKKEEKALRSHIEKMRRSKKPIKDAKSKAKKESLEYGRMLDAEEKRLIGEIDDMIAKAKEPLDVIEAARQYEKDWDEGHEMHELFKREEAIRLKEEEMQRIEEEKKAKAEAERIEKERIEREARIAREAEEKAKRDAEESLRKAEKAKAQAERDRIAAEEKAKQDAIEAEQRRIREAEEAKKLAEFEKAEAIRIEREKAAQAERDRIAAEERKRAEEKRIADAKAAEEARRQTDVDHRRKINAKMVEALVKEGLNEKNAKIVVTVVVKGLIPNMVVNY